MSYDHPLASPLLNEFLESIGQPALGEDDDMSCYICSETYLSGDSPEFPIALACGHKAGSNCIMKWLSPLRKTGRNSCPQCRAPVFDEWNSEDFPPPPPVMPYGNGPEERQAQIAIASSALSNIRAMLPLGGTAQIEVRGFGHLTLRAVHTRGRLPESRQTGDPTMDGRQRAASEAVTGAAARRIDRPWPAGYRDGADANARSEWRDYVERAETRNPQTTGVAGVYRPYRPGHAQHQAIETGFQGQLNGVTGNEAESSTPAQRDRRAPRTTTGQTLPDIFSPVAAVRPVRSSTTSATSTGLSADGLSAFGTYRDYWASEEYRGVRR